MSEPEDCHSSFTESSNLFDYLKEEQTGSSSSGPGKNTVENKVADANKNNYVVQCTHSEPGKEEVMDAEVSSITCKSNLSSLEESIVTPSDQTKEKELDTTHSGDRTSNDIDVAALSPCFPLIRDKDDLLDTDNEKEAHVTDICKHKNENIELDAETSSDAKDKYSNKPSVQSEFKDIEAKFETNNTAKLKGNIELEDIESRGINIVSSSLDKKNFVSDGASGEEKITWNPAADICDSSREPQKENSDTPQNADEGGVNKLKTGNCSDEEADNSGEASGDISFVSSLEDDDDQEPAQYNQITENVYLVDKKKTRLNKEIRRIRCDCVYEPDEPGFVGCGSSCLNRLLMIECGNKCGCGEFCTNKNFQRGCVYDLEVFKAGKKGWGVRANEAIDAGAFIIEYCGEVVNYKEFMERTETYDLEKRKHYYFMLLKGDEVIDATRSGSISRFINHSCDPNCVTQKWTVNGFLRVGFFSLREIQAGEELSFDYQYQRYGEKAQKCFCGSVSCRGVIGGKQMVLKPTGSNGESSKRRSKKKTSDYESDCKLEDDISELLGDENKITSTKQALELTRLMVKTETIDDRITLLKIVRNQSDSKALKAFIRYKGLSLLWSWMVDTPAKDMVFRSEVLNTLKILPIPNKNHLVDSKILPLVEKWSQCNDSPDSCTTRSDEDGSSSENEAGGADAKGEVDIDKKKTDKTAKNSTESKNASTDEESESEKQEIVESMANELLDNWKHLREVFKIPKKTQLTPEQLKPGTDASSSPVDEKRNGKRKIEGDKAHRLFSPNKRPFGPLPGQKTQSPIRPFPQDSSTSPFRPESPCVSVASPSTGWQGSSTDATDNVQQKDSSKTSLIQRLLKITSETRDEDSQGDYSERRNGDKKPYGEDMKQQRGRGRIIRGGNNAPFRGSPKHHEDFGVDRGNFRGGRGVRGRARGRGRGNSHHFGRQHHQFNDVPERQPLSGVNSPFGKRDTDPGQGRDFAGTSGMLFHQEGSRMPNDGSRMPSPYSYQTLAKPHRDRPSHPHDAVHLERQQNIHNEMPDTSSQRFSPMRHPRPNLNRFGKPGQEWQAPGSPFNSFRNQVQQGFSPAGMPASMNPTINPSNAPPPHFGTPPLSSRPPMASQPPLSSQLPLTSQPPPLSSHPPPPTNPVQNWNHNWPIPPRQGYPPQSLPTQNLPHPAVNPVNLVNRPPSLPNTNPTPVPPFPFNPDRMPNQAIVPSPQQPPPFFEASQQPPVLPNMPPKPFVPNTGQDHSQATTASIIKHLHELAQQSKLVSAQQQQQLQQQQQQQQQEQKQQLQPIEQMPLQKQQQQHQQQQQPPKIDQVEDYGQKTPETGVDNGISFVTPVKEKQKYRKSSGTPEVTESSKTISSLPPNWKTATDPEGKVYYYHVITRKTQWDVPKWEEEDTAKQTNKRSSSSITAGPRTPPASPPHSPISPALFSERPQAISDPSVSTTRMSTGHSSGQTEQLTPKQQKIRDVFKNKLSAVVVNCLNPYQKVDCKQARIAKIEDFKFLARKLTHGLMMKELARVKADEELECSDSVKIKVKEYIRNYMRKFGQFYIRS